MEKDGAAADGVKPVSPLETLKPAAMTVIRNESLMEAKLEEGSYVEYTELALDCLDLKAQEELLSPPLSGMDFKCLLEFTEFSCNCITTS